MKSTKKQQIIVKLGGEEFNYKGTIKKGELIDYYINQKNSLKNCYNRPSQVKNIIFNNWYNFFNNNEKIKSSFLKIKSFNSIMFTLENIIKMNHREYYIFITKTRQEIREII